MADLPAHNRLAYETSPYLLQHARNPVNWYPWSEAAFAAARERDCPILLSVGYSACHWCHVMERESFDDPNVATLMNAEFVSVKVDREERPDIDQVYMGVVQALTGQGGWPMTVFLTPEREPFFGGTYFPPVDMPGRPSFRRVLAAIADLWRTRRADAVEQGRTVLEHLRSAEQPRTARPATFSLDTLRQAAARLLEADDAELGGFGDAPKFPQAMALDFALRWSTRSDDGRLAALACRALDHMAAGGIFDHLGGGFHRYSTDRQWLVPHFEKMLYDNALLAQTYLRAYQMSGRPAYRDVAERTLEYVRREMTDPAGGFYSAQDADSEGEEGRYYVWTADEVSRILGPEDARIFGSVYDVAPSGNWEGRSILHLPAPIETHAARLGVGVPELAARLAEMRRQLVRAREGRVPPARDDKIVTAWNGMMLAAFADAARVLGRADFRQTAENNAGFLLREMVVAGTVMRTGRSAPHDVPVGMEHALHRSSAFRLAPVRGFLEDYACLTDGLLHLYEATYERHWLESAQGLGDAILARFAASDGGGFYLAEEGTDVPAPIRTRDALDGATPSGNSVAADVLLRLAVYTGEDRYRNAAQQALAAGAGRMGDHPLAFGRLLCVADAWLGPLVEVAVVGPSDNPATDALLAVTATGYWPNLVTAWAAPDDHEPSRWPLLANRSTVNGRPAAYVCVGSVCGLPITEPDELRDALSRATSGGAVT